MGQPLKGQCHCGAIRLTLWLPGETGRASVRACGCSFCRGHGARTLTDPEGRVQIQADGNRLNRYRFGLETADFLLCRHCGTYVGAVIGDDDAAKATINVNTLSDRNLFDPDPPIADYSGESSSDRINRRWTNWTPATLSVL